MCLCSPSGVSVEGTSFNGGRRREGLVENAEATFDWPLQWSPFSSTTTNLSQFFLSLSARVKTRISEALETRYCLFSVTYCSRTT